METPSLSDFIVSERTRPRALAAREAPLGAHVAAGCVAETCAKTAELERYIADLTRLMNEGRAKSHSAGQ